MHFDFNVYGNVATFCMLTVMTGKMGKRKQGRVVNDRATDVLERAFFLPVGQILICSTPHVAKFGRRAGLPMTSSDKPL